MPNDVEFFILGRRLKVRDDRIELGDFRSRKDADTSAIKL